jgi:protein gp37
MQEEWVLDIKTQCIEKGVPFFFKQWGGTNKKRAGRLLAGQVWDEMPIVYEHQFHQENQRIDGTVNFNCHKV